MIVVVAGVGFRFIDTNFMAARGHNVLMLLGVAVFGLMGIVMLWGSWHLAGDTRKFLKDAVPSTGKIIELRKNETKNSRRRYHNLQVEYGCR